MTPPPELNRAPQLAASLEPSRRRALQQMFLAVASCGLGGCGGGVGAPAQGAERTLGVVPPVSGSVTTDPPGPSIGLPPDTPLSRLKSALNAGPGLGVVAARPLTVRQGASNDSLPLRGTTASILPDPARTDGQSLKDLPQVWGHRRDTWTVVEPIGVGASRARLPVQLVHSSPRGQSAGLCGLHFEFDGRGFEVLFGGTEMRATVIADGYFMAPRIIASGLDAGQPLVPNQPFLAYDTFVAFDFGSAAKRRVSFYGSATFGPRAIAMGAADILTPWDRSAEPSLAVMADSYGGAPSRHWGNTGPFFEMAARLGIPHLDLNAIGGTGYAPLNASDDPRNAFVGRVGQLAVTAPDLVLTCGGINDDSGTASSGLSANPESKARFEQAVASYFQDLRRALPHAVLVATGPWQPQVARYPEVATAKVDVIRGALAAVTGPWVFIDNLQGGWVNSAGASSPVTGQPWQTGNGNVSAPRGDGNGDSYLDGDGVHPNEAGSVYLGEQLATALRAAIAAL